MINSFDLEKFMQEQEQEPVSIEFQQEVQYAYGDLSNTAVAAFPMERSVVLHIGERDYDVRELVNRLLVAEHNIYDLQSRVSQLYAQIDELKQQHSENRLFNDFSNITY